jgi:hypothetical protein
MRVGFRWSRHHGRRTHLRHAHGRWTATVPRSTRRGLVRVSVVDHAGRRSNGLSLRVLKARPRRVRVPSTATGVPAAFAGQGMWIWELPRSDGGDLQAIVARARAAHISTVFVKSSDGATSRWAQFDPTLVQTLHAAGLHVCAWQFVYGSDPVGEAGLGADAVADGADCLVVDAEGAYEGRYAAAQRYLATLRAAIGPDYPLGLTSFPYVDYHPGLPYSVFLGPGGAQANLPQAYWKTIGGGVDAVSAHTWMHNRIYGVPVAPLGQTYDAPPAADIARFRGIWAGYGATGLSWWDWQETSDALWAALAEPALPVAATDPGWPALGRGSKGDEVVWLQEHLASADASVTVDGDFGPATERALQALQSSAGLPATGVTDAATWQRVLALALAPVDWTASSGSAHAAAAGGRAPRSAHVPARRDEIPPALGHGRPLLRQRSNR